MLAHIYRWRQNNKKRTWGKHLSSKCDGESNEFIFAERAQFIVCSLFRLKSSGHMLHKKWSHFHIHITFIFIPPLYPWFCWYTFELFRFYRYCRNIINRQPLYNSHIVKCTSLTFRLYMLADWHMSFDITRQSIKHNNTSLVDGRVRIF